MLTHLVSNKKDKYSRVPRSPDWALMLLILVGMALRLIYLDQQSLWYDEAISVGVADRLSLWGVLANQAESSHPPLYYLLLRGWLNVVGIINDWIVRFPSVVSGVLTIPLIYVVATQYLNRRVGRWAAWVQAIFVFQVYYAHEARMYTLLAFLTTLSLYSFLRAIRANRWQDWLKYLVVLGLSLYTHYFIVFVVFIYHLYLLLYRQIDQTTWRSVLITDVALGVIFLPQIANFLWQSEDVVTNYWLVAPHLLTMLIVPYTFTFGSSLPAELTAVGLFIVLSVLTVGIWRLFRKTRSRPAQRSLLYLLLLGSFLPIVIVVLISQIVPIFLSRTLIICTPFFTLLFAWIIAKTGRYYLAGVLGCIIVVSFHAYYFDSTIHKPPYRQAAQDINLELIPEDIILHTSSGSYLPFLFYVAPSQNYLLWGNPEPRKTKTAFARFGGSVIEREQLNELIHSGRVWVVIALDQSLTYQKTQAAWLDQRFSRVKETEIGGIIIRLYEAPI